MDQSTEGLTVNKYIFHLLIVIAVGAAGAAMLFLSSDQSASWFGGCLAFLSFGLFLGYIYAVNRMITVFSKEGEDEGAVEKKLIRKLLGK